MTLSLAATQRKELECAHKMITKCFTLPWMLWGDECIRPLECLKDTWLQATLMVNRKAPFWLQQVCIFLTILNICLGTCKPEAEWRPYGGPHVSKYVINWLWAFAYLQTRNWVEALRWSACGNPPIASSACLPSLWPTCFVGVNCLCCCVS
jgi:hypothetical protein